MSNVLADIESRRAKLGLSRQELADRIHKDISTVNKQLSDARGASMTLRTAEDYAAALGGEIIMITDDAKKELYDKELTPLRDTITEQARELDRLKAELAHRDKLIKTLEMALDACNRKDAKIAQLYDLILGGQKL